MPRNDPQTMPSASLPAAAPGARGRTVSAAAAVAIALRAYAPFWLVVLAYVFITHAWMRTIPAERQAAALWTTASHAALIMIALLAVFGLWRLAVYVRKPPESPLRQLWHDARAILGNPARLLSLLVLFPTFYAFLQAFALFKGNIAQVNPFAWDETFMRLDQWLHGGRQPWEWLFPLLQSAQATTLVNFIYNAWFFVSIGTLLWAVGQRQPRMEAVRYLLAFLMAWIIGGSFLALVFSSAGPVYYSRLNLGGSPYTPLMDHLRTVAEIVPVWALDTQEMLWRGYQAKDATLGGISAFPSMHNAQATLVALLAWRFGKLLRWSAAAFAISIAIGSVWLGWHYAVDAYAGIAIAIVSWLLAGPLARWMMHRQAMRQLAQLQQRLDTQVS